MKVTIHGYDTLFASEPCESKTFDLPREQLDAELGEWAQRFAAVSLTDQA